MIIAVEANALSQERITGVGNVILHYLNALQKIDRDNSYLVYSMDGLKHIIFTSDRWREIDFNYWLKRTRIRTRLKWLAIKSGEEQIRFRSGAMLFFRALKIALEFLDEFVFTWKLASSLKRERADIYIATSTYYYPYFFRSSIKQVGILYDLVWKLYPGTMEFGTKVRMILFTLRNMKKAELLVAISENTKTDAQNLLRIPTRIKAIPLAADPTIFYRADSRTVAAVKKKYGISKKYILSVCTLEPRKNLKTLIAAYCTMPSRYNYQLVLAGMTGWIGSNFFRDLEESGVMENILITGYISANELAPIYTGAELFVFPSLYEGFGLPVLEAMQCGCPVITSNSSSIPEVAGDAAVMIDPEDVKELSDTIERILGNISLRRTLSSKGLRRARLFSWERSAKILLDALSSLDRPNTVD